MKRPIASRRQRLGLLAMVLAALLAFWLGWPFHAFSDNSAFEPVGTEQLMTAHKDRIGIARSRLAHINWAAVSPEAGRIRLNLFDNTVLEADRVRVDRSTVDGYVWVGWLVGSNDSLVLLSRSGNVLAGSIFVGGVEKYTIQTTGVGEGVGLHVIREVDQTAALEPQGPDTIIPPLPTAAELPPHQLDEPCEDGSVIDIMVAYTSEARVAQGGTSAIEALINQRLSAMNEANLASEAGFTWRLAHAMETGYQESGDMWTDLVRLQDSADGYLDEIPMARDQYQADITGLLVAEGNGNICGLAYQMNVNDAWFGSFAYSVSALDYAEPYSCNSLTLAHELGHNMGNAHDRENTSTEPLQPYSYGHQSPDESFRTIMSYNCPGGCPRINQWSNPDVDYQDRPTGIEYEQDPAKAADIIRSMNDVRQTVANFRPNCNNVIDPTPTATATPLPTPTASPTSAPPQPTPTATVPPLPYQIHLSVLVGP